MGIVRFMVHDGKPDGLLYKPTDVQLEGCKGRRIQPPR